MPNHIVNILKVNGSDEQVKNVFAHMKTEYSEFDFNKIIPMPEELNIESSSDGRIGMEYLLYKSNDGFERYVDTYERIEKLPDERKNQIIELGKKYLSNLAKYGYTNWYDWCRVNWGTKWNAYDIEKVDDYTIEFNTAWSGVSNLIRQLSLKFPEVEFEYTFADEDAGYNTGKRTIVNGESEMFYPTGGSKESFDIYFETHEWAREYYLLEDGEYKYVEE